MTADHTTQPAVGSQVDRGVGRLRTMLDRLEIAAWADGESNRCSRKLRPDWNNPEALVFRSDVEAIAAQAEKVAELKALVEITRSRCAHLEIELAQARASRDGLKEKYDAVVAWMKKHVVLKSGGGGVLTLPTETPNVRAERPQTAAPQPE